MVFYAIFACTPLLVALAVKQYYQCPINESKRARRAFLFFSGLILWLVIALRDKEVGSTDSAHYYRHWDNMAFRNVEGLMENFVKSRMEPGYLCSTWLLSKIFPHPQFAFVCSGLVFTISVCLFIYRNSDHVVISFIMFITWGLYGFMVQGLRQGLAMSICLFSIESVKKRKLWKFIFQILLALTFHKSAIVFSIVYFLPWKRLSLTSKLQMFSASVALIACSAIVIVIGTTLLNREYSVEVQEGGGYVALTLYIMLVLGGTLFIQHSKTVENVSYNVVLLGTEEERRSDTLFFALTLISFSFFVMRYTGMGIMERISFYFQFGQLILLPKVIKRFDKGSQNIAYTFAILLSVLLLMFRVENTALAPYKFFFLD